MPIYMTARYKVRPQSLDKCKRAITEFVEYIREHEPGTQVYIAQQEILNPTSFLHTVVFENEAAMAIHRNSDAVERFVKTLYPETLAPVEFTEFNLVAAKNE